MLPLRHQKSAENIPSLCNSLDPNHRRAVPSGWHDPTPPIPVSEDQLPPGFGDPAQTQHLPREAPLSPPDPQA